MGTGFLHKSGFILTAAHVISKCQHPKLITPRGAVDLTIKAQDARLDLALLKAATPVPGTPLTIRTDPNLNIGAPVAIWGFPGGYYGDAPMFSAGYLAGADTRKVSPTEQVTQWIVNAAFNSGNSGGPLVVIETGEVIGLVSSKVTGLSDSTQTALAALQGQGSGFVYTATKPDGSTISFSEGQVVAMVLEDLRNQVQLVIGRAVIIGDITDFLKANKIEP